MSSTRCRPMGTSRSSLGDGGQRFRSHKPASLPAAAERGLFRPQSSNDAGSQLGAAMLRVSQSHTATR